MAWLEAVTHGRTWERSRDAQRIRGAFVTLAQTCDRWPSPKQFLAALPDSTQLRLTGTGDRPADPPELTAALREIKPEERITSIAHALRELGPRVEPVSAEEKAQAERELRQHYQRDGKAAAAGDA